MNAKLSAVAGLLAVLILPVGTAEAASACKGLSESACSANPDCGWTEGYTRKDGRKVGAYCRTTSRGKKSAQAAAAKPKG